MSNENSSNTTGSDTWNQPYQPANPPSSELGYNERLKEATKRVNKKLIFYRTLTSYLVVNAFLWVLWLMTGASYPWPVWVTMGWGIGLAFQALDAFVLGISAHQRRQMVEEEMRRMGHYR
ncbi:MAG: hypothetical protein JWP00_1074 [Chloroflexi bacterium]|nr:hypothetical protein [Chloroflexota bacterium]